MAKGEVTITIGGQPRLLRFRTAEMVQLEERLNSDVMTFLANGRGSTRFLTEAVFVGHAHADRKLTPSKVKAWFDEFDGDTGDMLREVLYAIASGRPGKEAAQMTAALDASFYPEGGSPGPLGSGSAPVANTTT